jgi:two-component system chemotaxis sensor kinase CheA
MDSVRQAVEALGGRVGIESALGSGTLVTLRLPVAASMIRLLTVRVGPELYGAPLSAIVETAHIPREGLTPVGSGVATVWRGRTLPVLHLHDLVGAPKAGTAGMLRMLVVAADDGEQVGLVVDAFAGRAEGVMRPLTGLLAGLPGVLGATMTPEGGVLFVLDLPGLLR